MYNQNEVNTNTHKKTQMTTLDVLDEKIIQMIKDFTMNPNIRMVYMYNDHYMSCIDITMHIEGTNPIRGSEEWNRIWSKNKQFWLPYLKKYQFPGPGQKNKYVINTEGAYKLIMTLKGKGAIKTRLHIVDEMKDKLEGQGHILGDILHQSLKKRALEKEEETEQESIEYIYATASDAFPGLIKIGRTHDVQKRLASANTFCAPMPHKLLISVPTLNSIQDEKRVHEFFKNQHVAGEFFRVTVAEVEECLQRLISFRKKK